MINLSVDSNNDLYIGNDGLLATSQGVTAVLESASHAAKAQLGEMVLAIDVGVPNFQTIWETSANIAQFEAYLLSAIQAVENVIEVRELTTRVENGTVFYTAVIVTTYGEGIING
jgi:hypothetical protein